MLEGVEETSIQTTRIISGIKALMLEYKHKMRSELPKIYSQDLLNLIFRHPYTKIQHVIEEIGVRRLAASKYLDALDGVDLLNKLKIGRDNYFVNTGLMELLSKAQDM